MIQFISAVIDGTIGSKVFSGCVADLTKSGIGRALVDEIVIWIEKFNINRACEGINTVISKLSSSTAITSKVLVGAVAGIAMISPRPDSSVLALHGVSSFAQLA